MSEDRIDRGADAIAVIGMAGRFPRAEDLAAFWRNLWMGEEGISRFSDEELLAAGVDPLRLADPSYVRARAVLEGLDLFDAGFFGFSPREAEITNPQHRFFLECAWQALEDASCDPARHPGAIGVFASASSNTYLLDVYSHPELLRQMGAFRVQIANEKEFLPTWVSYKLDLKGPSVNVQTACSSSLVAVHMACQSLLNGECDLALVGGVSARGLTRSGYLYQEGGIFSPDGRCRAFDAEAGGTVSGDGVGVVVLKRLEEALADGDNVRAVILGSAVNNDGASKVGYTAPGLEGQTRVVSEALSIAGVEPETVTCIETHGTGTRLGDPIEVSALTDAYRTRTRATGFCALGSLKSNLGHLDAAAGVAGLIKTVLALENRRLPPSLHFRRPNPEIDFASTPFYVNAAPAEWRTGEGAPRRAGVSSFGIGGTNAHLILEEAPPVESGPSREWKLLVWSARTEAALDAATAGLARALAGGGDDLADVAHTLRGRRAFAHRRALVCRDAREAAAALEEPGTKRIASSPRPARERRVAFLFPGQGAQRAGMTRELYRDEPVFRASVNRCAERLVAHLGGDLREVLYPAGEGEQAESRLAETLWAQPALFVVEWALAELWRSRGVEPCAVLGHSVGEYAAACVAGVLELDDALALVAARSRLMQGLPAGGMLAVPLAEEEIVPLLGEKLSLAAVNAPRRCVVSGALPDLEELEQRLVARGIEGRRLLTSHAFHSWMMDAILPAFEEQVRATPRREPEIPWMSGLSGDWITSEEATGAGIWTRQLRAPVRFGSAVGRLLQEPGRILLEVGPGQTLTSLVQHHPYLREDHLTIASLRSPRHPRSEPASLLDAQGLLWVAGVDVDWSELTRGERRRRVSLPTYPFERQRYWIEIPRRDSSAPAASPADRADAGENKEHFMSEATVIASPDALRHGAILDALKEVVRDLLGAAPGGIDPHASFLEVGVDSLLLIQASLRLQDRFGVKLTMVQLLEELTTLDSVAAHLVREMPEERWAALLPLPAPVPTPVASAAPSSAALRSAEVPAEPTLAVPAAPAALPPAPAPVPAGADPESPSTSSLERILVQQLQLMTHQLQVLQGARPSSGEPAASPAVEPARAVLPEKPQPVSAASAALAAAPYTRFGPYHPIEAGPHGGLTPRQQAHLDELIQRYTARTAKSKAMTQTYRPVLADGRCSVGFRRLWKELIYPIHGQRSRGSRLWDVDGNEYVDINMGFGLHFFGHSPDFVMEAMERQMHEGLELGPQSPLAGRAAELVCELTGMDRAVFCNSGTEAVMGALRAARTVTRRSKIALFSNSYHGWADSTLVRGQLVDGRRASLPAVPGISPCALDDVLVLEYASPEALELLKEQGEELAAVLVEPVRSRSPELQPREFLHAVRELTARSGTLLIFDEMVTGFRIHPGGAQAHFGVEADLATYGKLMASGLPIGAIAGRSRFMDVLDGGMWSFGDGSYPTVEKTMMAGAFFKHPLTMAATCAVLERMRQEGAGLHDRLNRRTARLAADLNADFQAAGVPIEMVCFGSQFRFRPGRELQHSDLFFYHLLEKGIFYTLESGNCFLTTAHTEEDLDRLRQAVRTSVEQLQEGGFLPGSPAGGPPPRGRREPAVERRMAGVSQASAPAPSPIQVSSLRATETASERPAPAASGRGVDLSLYYFGTYAAAYDPAKYELLLEGARFADAHGFAGIWLPERHFHSFGGISPNPSVVAAALARETKHLRLRAGSVVVPLHHPVRLAEEWSVVDNLSDGRVGVSFASGWHANDFVFAPDVYEQRRAVMYEGIEKVRALWRGEPLRVRDGAGQELDIHLHPLPKQREIPVWLTASGPDTFVRAGEMGVGVLTNLQSQSLDELARKLELYREAFSRCGHDPAAATVTLLLHTYVGPDFEAARARAAGPLRSYLRSSLGLTRKMLASRGRDIDLDKLPPEDLDYLLGAAYERYAADHALIGTPESCSKVVERLRGMGVTEIGCLVDFGIDTPSVLEGLTWLDRVRAMQAGDRSEPAWEELPAVLAGISGFRETPASEPQRALWLASKISPDASRAYNEPLVLRLRGPLHVAALRAALQTVVDRHEVLRAHLAADGSAWRIAGSLRVELAEVDLSELPAGERSARAQAWLEREVGEPFDLERGPLFRCRVVRTGELESYLAVTMHHLVTDGHSGNVILGELRALYAAACKGEPCALAEAARFGEQMEWLATGPSPEAGLPEAEVEDYWIARFADPVPPLELPADHPRPRIASHRGARRTRALDASLTAALRSLGAAQGATLLMSLLAGYGALLHRLTCQEDLVVGVPSRDMSAVAVGYFLKLLPLRLQADGAPAFNDYLGRVKRALLEARQHQDYPLSRLVEKLNPGRDPGRPAMVSASLNLERSGEAPRFLDLESEVVRVHTGASRFDLHLNCIDTGGGLLLECEYRIDLFTAATIDRWLLHLEALLRGAVARPETSLPLLPLLSPAQEHQLRIEQADAVSFRPAGSCLHRIFESRVQERPDAPAVTCEGETWTYRQLDERANRLAHHLRRRGVEPGARVALCLERSLDLVAGLLGVLKTGAAYVPIDPQYPRERRSFLLADSQASLLLTEERLLGGLDPRGLAAVFLDSGRAAIGEEPGSALSLDVPVDAPAYVIYTSGSTGRPKGVVVSHASVVRLFTATDAWFQFGSGDVWTLFHSFAFDFSVWELWGALLHGGRLVVVPYLVSRSPESFRELLVQEKVTVLSQTPSAFRQLLRADEAAAPEVSSGLALRRVVFGGEALDPASLAPWFARHGDRRPEMVNMYGITETTVHVTCRLLRAEDADGPSGSAIGRPIPDLTLHVLGAGFAPVPMGVPGEIYVGGPGLAHGYLGRPELTAERFVPDPFAAVRREAGARLYRTGDLARSRPGGDLEYLGRIDHQVKIRGLRIELGEIESVLATHPAVREVAVVVREVRAGDPHLVAYTVAAPGAPPATAELRAFLKDRLPAHMVPAAFVPLDALPLTSNGKLDRLALPVPAGSAAPAVHLAPAGGLEQAIAAIWREVLGVDKVGATDNFFDLGGHSLRLIEVQGRLRDALGRNVSVIELFEHATIQSLARHLAGAEPGAGPTREAPSRETAPAEEAGEAADGFAVIGMAGRFPGAASLDELWANLRDGVESIVTLSDEELLEAGGDSARLAEPGYVKRAAELAGADLFDAELFGFSPREAEVLDPQQRILLECSWQALENAGHDSRRCSGPVGVYVGSQMSTYMLNLLSRPEIVDSVGLLAVQAGVDKDFAATRVSYELGLEGPSLAVQTACSSSLVAIHLACQALAAGECDMALAGGVSVRVPQRTGYLYQEGGIRSADGHCRAFDEKATGTVFGSGAGIVVLKRLRDALRDGDTIHAVVKGSAVNNDGSVKVGYTAPGIEGQAKVIAAAQRAARVHPDTITYVEAHGTGTPLGDPIEVTALNRAFRTGGAGRTGFCALGSVKTNVGHLDAAAGVTGFLKTVLALTHREIPPSLHCDTPNPKLGLAESPFYVSTKRAQWRTQDGAPRRAGVSSFGLGGTNAHVILEEAREPQPSGPSRRQQLLPISARTPRALEEATDRLAAFLAAHPGVSLADVAWTLQVGRRELEHRRILVCDTAEDAVSTLTARDARRLLASRVEAVCRPVAFLFPGQGAQHVGMGRELYASEAVFRRELDACSRLLRPRLGCDLRDLLDPVEGRSEEAARELRRTRFAQPALFAVEHSLARLWLSWGVRPWAMIGHSLGEYVAACLAGVLSLEDALDLVATRGELMEALPAGAMIAVDLAESELRDLLGRELSLAAVNGPSLCVASGPEAAVAALEARLAERGTACRRLHTSHAFHSAMMEPMLRPFTEQVERLKLAAPSIPYLSNLTGTWITAAEATDPAYWARHLRQTVRFGDGASRLLAESGAVLLEVGPGRTLGSLVRRLPGTGARPETAASMPHPKDPQDGAAFLLQALGRLWLAGVEIDWPSLVAGETRRRLPLPTYPFQRRRFWIEAARGVAAGSSTAPALASGQEPLPGHARPDLEIRYEAPSNQTEQTIAVIWQTLLGIERIGIHDDFFELGGHSLLATQALSRLREALQVEISLDSFFAAPTVSGLARVAADAASCSDAGPRVPPIRPVPRDEPTPLSFSQQRLWFLDRLQPGSSAYNVPLAVRLRGPLDAGSLRASLGEIVRRHESLRTAFEQTAGEPVQRIVPAADLRILTLDLRALPEPRRDLETRRLVCEEALRPFDLSGGILLRGALIALDTEEHLALVTMHHIASDAWSIGVLVRELTALYRAFSLRLPSPLPELQVQYADFAAWQRRWLSGAVLDGELAYWRERLGDIPPTLELPGDRPRPATPSFQGRSRSRRLTATLSEAVRELARREGATLFMTLLAVFQALLARYSGQEDFAVGTPVAGRNHVQTEDLIGFFVNTLVLRADAAGDPVFRELLGRVRASALDAFVHQGLPFEKLVAELQPERTMSHSPLFQVMFILQNAPAGSLASPGLVFEPLVLESQTARFDLTVSTIESASGLGMVWELGRDLFDGSTAERMARHFEALLAGFAADPETRLSRVPLLSAEERGQLLVEWNDTGVASLAEAPVHELFNQWALRSPDGEALRFAGLSLSYGQLRRGAERVAAALAATGVGPEVRVGLCADPSPQMIAGLLGILMAGGAFVPLDPSYPADRLALILEDAGATVVLVQEHLRPILGGQSSRLLCLEAIENERLKAPAPCRTTLGNQASYVVYTSGSTGRPKGVVATHQGLANFSQAMAARLGLGSEDRVLQFASVSFDASFVQIFPALVSGATVVLHRNPRHLSPQELLGFCTEERVTVLDLPAALWREWVAAVAESHAAMTAPIRMYLTGGETVPVAVLREWARKVGDGAGFLSSYGPTEATVTTTAFQAMSEEAGRIGGVDLPLGNPLANTRVYLLDRHLEAVPVGVVGELYLGGVGVTRGYLGRPDLTAERYLPDSCSGDPGARVYRTGDLARRAGDGSLHFLGRADHQVKLRGYRVELGEIEAAVRAYAGILSCAVLVREEEEKRDRALVAYVVPEEIRSFSPDGLLAALGAVLPAHLVPSHVIALPRLPVTPNGKLDRSALPAPETAGRPRRPEVVAPRTSTEHNLRYIWEELLSIRPIGVRDNFFDLGGHSLLAVRLLARINSRFGHDLPFSALFEEPTIEHLAGILDGRTRTTGWVSLVPIQAKGTRPPFFCIHPIGGSVVGYYHLARHLGPDQPFYGLQAPGLESERNAPHMSIEDMAANYLAEVQSLRPHGPYLLGGASFGGIVAYEMAQQLLRRGEEVTLLAVMDAPVPPGRSEGLEFDYPHHCSGLVRELARQQGKELALTAEELRGLELDDQLRRVLAALRETNLVGPEVDTLLLRHFIEGYRWRRTAIEPYKAQPYPGHIKLVRPHEIDLEHLRQLSPERQRQFADPTLGWGDLAVGGVEVHRVPGYHETMTAEPNVRELASVLNACIAQAVRDPEVNRVA